MRQSLILITHLIELYLAAKDPVDPEPICEDKRDSDPYHREENPERLFRGRAVVDRQAIGCRLDGRINKCRIGAKTIEAEKRSNCQRGGEKSPSMQFLSHQ